MEESTTTRPGKSLFQKVQSVAANTVEKLGSLLWSSESPTTTKLTFRIIALRKETVATVKESLRTRLEKLVDTSEIRSGAVATLSPQDEKSITALRSTDVGIKIDKSRSLIRLTGKKKHVGQTNREISQLLQRSRLAASASEVNPDDIKEREGTAAYLRLLGSESQVRYPEYWQGAKNNDFSLAVESRHQQLNSAGTLYKEVEKLVVGTWETTKVGQGRDASNLNHRSIAVKNIWVVENSSLFAEYTERRKRLCKVASVNQLPPRINGLKREHEVYTRRFVGSQLNKSLIGEINEYFLFHGTKKSGLKSIENQGLDSRLSNNSMFGTGVYFAESSTKADQYADEKSKRSSTGQPLYLFVSRVLLGNTFVCSTPTPYKRPPCSHAGCTSVNASAACHAHAGVTFDSVIGTHREGSSRLIFREFVVYEKSLSYPEFLVEYVRQN